MWYVGWDCADTHHDVEVLDEVGKRAGAQRLAHSHAGLNESKAFLLSIAAQPAHLACMVETNHGWLITFLLEAGIPAYPVNPKTVNQLRKAAGAKTVLELHRPQLVSNQVIVRAKSRLMLSLVKHLLVVIEEIKSNDKAITPLFLTQNDQEIWR